MEGILWIFCVAIIGNSLANDEHSKPDFDRLLMHMEELQSKQLQTEREVAHLRQVTSSQQKEIRSLETKLQREVKLHQNTQEIVDNLCETIFSFGLPKNDVSKSYTKDQDEHDVSRDITDGRTDRFMNISTEDVHNPRNNGMSRIRPSDEIESAAKDPIDSRKLKKSRPMWNYQANQFRRQVPGEGISFSAYMDHDMNIPAAQTIKFNKIITNEGNGYNTFTGVFTCQESGMYYFHFSVGARGNGQVDGILMVNNKRVVEAFTEGAYPTDDEQASTATVVRLSMGDVVWVDGLGHVHSSENWRVTSFCGFFLHP